MNTEFDPTQVGPMCWGDCESFLPLSPKPGDHPFLCEACRAALGDVSPAMQTAATRFEQNHQCPTCGSGALEDSAGHCSTCRVIQYVKAKAAEPRKPRLLSLEELTIRTEARARAGRLTPEEISARAEARETGRLKARQKAKLVLTCPVCGRAFNPVGAQRCCSLKCKVAYTRGECGVCHNYDTGPRVCATCGEKFESDRPGQVHCSPHCAAVFYGIPEILPDQLPEVSAAEVEIGDIFTTETIEELAAGPGQGNLSVKVTRQSDGQSLSEPINKADQATREYLNSFVFNAGFRLAEKLGYRAGIDRLE